MMNAWESIKTSIENGNNPGEAMKALNTLDPRQSVDLIGMTDEYGFQEDEYSTFVV